MPPRSASARRPHQGHHAQHHGGGGHQDRPQPHRRRFFNRLTLAVTSALQFVGKLHDQDAVLGDQPQQRHQTDLGVHVDRGVAHGDKGQGAEQGRRHREQNHHRVAKALELERQRQVNDQDRKQQQPDEAARLLNELARLAGEIRGVARRCHVGEDGIELGQQLALGHAADAR